MAKADLTSQAGRTPGSGKFRRIRVGHPVSFLSAEMHLSDTFPIFFQQAVRIAEQFAKRHLSTDSDSFNPEMQGLRDRDTLFRIGLDRSEQRALYAVYLQHAAFLLMFSQNADARTLSYQYAARAQQELSRVFLQLSSNSRRRLFYAGSEALNSVQSNAWKRACSGAFAVARLMSALREMDVPLALPTVQLDTEAGIDLITPPHKRQQGICWQIKRSTKHKIRVLSSEFRDVNTEAEELAARTWRGVRYFNRFYNLHYAAVLAFVGGPLEVFWFDLDTELHSEIQQCLVALARPPIFSAERDVSFNLPSV